MRSGSVATVCCVVVLAGAACFAQQAGYEDEPGRLVVFTQGGQRRAALMDDGGIQDLGGGKFRLKVWNSAGKQVSISVPAKVVRVSCQVRRTGEFHVADAGTRIGYVNMFDKGVAGFGAAGLKFTVPTKRITMLQDTRRSPALKVVLDPAKLGLAGRTLYVGEDGKLWVQGKAGAKDVVLSRFGTGAGPYATVEGMGGTAAKPLKIGIDAWGFLRRNAVYSSP